MPCAKRRRTFYLAIYQLHSAGDLTGTEASGADVHVSGSPIHNRLHALHVGLPGAVGAAVGVGDLDTEGYALATKITFRHLLHLPSGCLLNKLRPLQALDYDTRLFPKMQALFSKFFDFLKMG